MWINMNSRTTRNKVLGSSESIVVCTFSPVSVLTQTQSRVSRDSHMHAMMHGRGGNVAAVQLITACSFISAWTQLVMWHRGCPIRLSCTCLMTPQPTITDQITIRLRSVVASQLINRSDLLCRLYRTLYFKNTICLFYLSLRDGKLE